MPNELSELILQRSQPFLASKGYLSMFRNLTDAQPLADGVLQALQEQNARELAAAAAPGPGLTARNPSPPAASPQSTQGHAP